MLITFAEHRVLESRKHLQLDQLFTIFWERVFIYLLMLLTRNESVWFMLIVRSYPISWYFVCLCINDNSYSTRTLGIDFFKLSVFLSRNTFKVNRLVTLCFMIENPELAFRLKPPNTFKFNFDFRFLLIFGLGLIKLDPNL